MDQQRKKRWKPDSTLTSQNSRPLNSRPPPTDSYKTERSKRRKERGSEILARKRYRYKLDDLWSLAQPITSESIKSEFPSEHLEASDGLNISTDGLNNFERTTSIEVLQPIATPDDKQPPLSIHSTPHLPSLSIPQLFFPQPIFASCVLCGGKWLDTSNAYTCLQPFCHRAFCFECLTKVNPPQGYTMFDPGTSRCIVCTYQFRKRPGTSPKHWHYEFDDALGQKILLDHIITQLYKSTDKLSSQLFHQSLWFCCR